MLKKIIAVKNVGKFINSAHSGVQECPKTTLIFGGNGFGKTTLASILRSNGANDPAIIAGRTRLGAGAPPDVELLFATARGARRRRNFSCSMACLSPRTCSPATLWIWSSDGTYIV
jgi:hypothetical protein